MPILRLAYITLFLIALLAVFTLWSQVGGQSHLDLMPWYLKLVLGVGAALAAVKASVAAVSNKNAWNGATLRWCGILLILLVGCGVASYYVHIYGEDDDQDNQDDTVNSALVVPAGAEHFGSSVAQASSLPCRLPSRHRPPAEDAGWKPACPPGSRRSAGAAATRQAAAVFSCGNLLI